MSTLTLGFLSLFLQSAHASPTLTLPEVSKGSLPYASYSGTLCDVPTDIVTVPEGQDFLVTMVSTTTDGGSSRWGDWYEHHTSMLLRDDEIALTGQHIGKKSSIDIARGEGRLPVGSGSTLRIRSIETWGDDCQHKYYVQGYFIQTDSPYRSYFNNSAIKRTVLTVDSGKTFLVRTIAIASRESPLYCDVYVDGNLVLEGNSWAMSDTHWGAGTAGGFSAGKGTLVLTEGQVLSIGPEDPTAETQCDYYVAGEYMRP